MMKLLAMAIVAAVIAVMPSQQQEQVPPDSSVVVDSVVVDSVPKAKPVTKKEIQQAALADLRIIKRLLLAKAPKKDTTNGRAEWESERQD